MIWIWNKTFLVVAAYDLRKGVFLFQTIVLSFGAANGLGKPVDTLSDDRLRRSLEVSMLVSVYM